MFGRFFSKGLVPLMGLSLIIGLAAHAAAVSSSDSEISVRPDKPIVVTGDSQDGNGHVIHAPWFAFQLKLNNNEARPITIVAVTVTYSSATGDQVIMNISPSDFNLTFTCENGLSAQINYSDFGVFEAGESGPLHLTFRQSLPPACKNIDTDQVATFYVDHLPRNPQGHVYHVTVNVQGWYGSYLQPRQERFEKSFEFETQ